MILWFYDSLKVCATHFFSCPPQSLKAFEKNGNNVQNFQEDRPPETVSWHPETLPDLGQYNEPPALPAKLGVQVTKCNFFTYFPFPT